MKTVLTTGVGAVIGYGILRSLRGESDVELIGTDIFPDAVGQAWCDLFVQAPPTSSPDYIEWLGNLVVEKQVDLVIPGIEQDSHRLSDARAETSGWRARIALNDARLVTLSKDKWLMHEELLLMRDPSRIPSALQGSHDSLVERFGSPFLVKPRRGYASKGLARISSPAGLESHIAKYGSEFIAQPLVGTNDQEFTVGVFGDGAGQVAATITLRRTLAPDGSTAKAWVCEPDGLNAAVTRLCAHFRPLGPTNLQFRRDGDNWKLLEINPRISSSTSLRTAFGYNEAKMCIDYFVHGNLPVQPVIRDGFAARYIEDHVVYDRHHF